MYPTPNQRFATAWLDILSQDYERCFRAGNPGGAAVLDLFIAHPAHLEMSRVRGGVSSPPPNRPDAAPETVPAMIQSYLTNPEAFRRLLAEHDLTSSSKAAIRRFVKEKTGKWVHWRTLDKAIRLGGPSRKDTVELLARAFGVAFDKLLAERPGVRSKYRPLRVAVLMSSDVSYLHDIEFGLRQGLESLTEPLGRSLEYYAASQWSEPTQDLSPRRWEKVAKRLLDEASPSGFDYIVGLGTPASKALKDAPRQRSTGTLRRSCSSGLPTPSSPAWSTPFTVGSRKSGERATDPRRWPASITGAG